MPTLQEAERTIVTMEGQGGAYHAGGAEHFDDGSGVEMSQESVDKEFNEITSNLGNLTVEAVEAQHDADLNRAKLEAVDGREEREAKAQPNEGPTKEEK